jgi:predicted amidohydrolase
VTGGASFKAVADVLGHKSISTTLIYAKLDLKALAEVALPWPGVRDERRETISPYERFLDLEAHDGRG